MERSVRNGRVRYVLERRRGLAALVFLAAPPWTLLGLLAREPAFYAVAGLFLGAALWAFLPVRTLDVDRAAGTLLLSSRSLMGRVERRTLPLDGLRVRRVEDAVWIDLPGGGSVSAGRGPDAEEFRRLAEDLGGPLRG